MFEIIIGIISLAFSGSATIAGLIPYFRKTNDYKNLAQTLEKINHLPMVNTGEAKGWNQAQINEYMSQWIEYGTLIFSILWRKIFIRLIGIIIFIIVTAIGTSLDFNGYYFVILSLMDIEITDIIWILGCAVGSFLLLRIEIINDSEKEFLKKLHFISRTYCEEIIKGPIDRFNLEFENIHLKTKYGISKEKSENEAKKIMNMIKNYKCLTLIWPQPKQQKQN